MGFVLYYIIGFRSIKNTVAKRVINVLAQAHERELIGEACQVQLDLDEHGNVVIAQVTPSEDPGAGDDNGSGVWNSVKKAVTFK